MKTLNTRSVLKNHGNASDTASEVRSRLSQTHHRATRPWRPNRLGGSNSATSVRMPAKQRTGKVATSPSAIVRFTVRRFSSALTERKSIARLNSAQVRDADPSRRETPSAGAHKTNANLAIRLRLSSIREPDWQQVRSNSNQKANRNPRRPRVPTRWQNKGRMAARSAVGSGPTAENRGGDEPIRSNVPARIPRMTILAQADRRRPGGIMGETVTRTATMLPSARLAESTSPRAGLSPSPSSHRPSIGRHRDSRRRNATSSAKRSRAPSKECLDVIK